MTEGMPEVRFVGTPDGPKKFVPAIGLEVETFTQEPGGNYPALDYHVPLNMRGPFRPDQLAHYDPEHEYRVNSLGYVVCKGTTAEDKPCRQKALNRTPWCAKHGGRLHPLDKLLTATGEPETEENRSRYQMFLAGQITVADLDDDELLGMGFRTASGKLFKPKNIPREMFTEFTRGIFERSLDKLKSSALEAANTLAGLMMDPTVDASVRRQCAESILDRTLGKAPLNVSLTTSSPFEQIFEAISATPISNAIDAEVVEDSSQEPESP